MSFVIHETIKKQLDTYVESNIIPNILFHGPHGSGKKHLLQYMLDKMYAGIDDRQQYIMKVNCAFGKGIKFIRDELKFFAKTNIHNQEGNHPIVKTIILLYGEHLTTDAQSALRRCIELFSTHTRFIMIVEDKTKLLLPIISRMAEIYVNYPYFNKRKAYMNVHVRNKLQDTITKKKKYKTIQTCMDKLKECFSNKSILHQTHSLYEKGISLYDVIKYIDENGEPELQKYEYLVEMDNIRHTINYEKMALFIGLNKYVIRFLI